MIRISLKSNAAEFLLTSIHSGVSAVYRRWEDELEFFETSQKYKQSRYCKKSFPFFSSLLPFSMKIKFFKTSNQQTHNCAVKEDDVFNGFFSFVLEVNWIASLIQKKKRIVLCFTKQSVRICHYEICKLFSKKSSTFLVDKKITHIHDLSYFLSENL